MQRVEVTYRGSVQGVGFRFAARRAAKGTGITGFVKNLPDGNVLAVGEGTEVQLKSFLDGIAGIMGEYIKNSQVDWQQATGEFSSFDIRF